MSILLIQWYGKVKQHLVEKFDEGKWAPKPLLNMGPLIPLCAPTQTLISKEGKKLECGIKRIWFLEF